MTNLIPELLSVLQNMNIDEQERLLQSLKNKAVNREAANRISTIGDLIAFAARSNIDPNMLDQMEKAIEENFSSIDPDFDANATV